MNRGAKTTVVVFFIFMLLHQTDKLLIGPLQTPIMDTFKMSYTQWGLINSGALIVGTLFYPLWGWLSDKYNRGKLLAIASFIWGSTTWLSALAPNFKSFLVTRSSTGIDDSSYPGMYSLISDLYSPKVRGKVYGILQLTQPIGYLIGMVVALMLTEAVGGWKNIFIITGSLGIMLAVVIYFTVKDVPRGSSETELQGVEIHQHKFNWKSLSQIFKKKSLWMVYAQGFAGVFPWNVITYYIFGYLGTERGYDETTTLMIMAPAILLMAAGYPAGGWLGDKIFKKNKGGRLIASEIGVVLGMVGLFLAMNTPNEQVLLFGVLLCLTAFFMPFASPNIISTMYDVTLPEVRSSAQSVESLIETAGAWTAPILAGVLADATSVGFSIKLICTAAWSLCVVFLLIAIFFIPKDINSLHKELEARAFEDARNSV
ncbi:MAG: MFS transporter [Chloroflexi bacterium HGW-Chloroflexi-4]|nr:MAG: MFS transporter [Chloroflexi bacterium HGW-Chloroflexi-4]